jgi:hypothetical protein
MVTSKMNDIFSSLMDEEQKLQKTRLSMKVPDLTINDYWSLIQRFGTHYITVRGQNSEFLCDSYNRDVLYQLYLYLKGDPSCKLDVNRGIYMTGTIGSGKTILMKTFLSVMDRLTHHLTKCIPCKNLYEVIREKGINNISSGPLFLDDLGRENIEEIDYGRKITPIIDLFSSRYENGAMTFATSNFKLETLEGDKDHAGYGTFIITRMEEMFNVVVLPGACRRKKYIYER